MIYGRGQVLELIETLTPQYLQDVVDATSGDVPKPDAANAALKRYGSIILEAILQQSKGKYVVAGHVQQLVQKLQRSPFLGIVVSVCTSLHSKMVCKETYQNDIAPFLNKMQRRDFAAFMKRVNASKAQHAAHVEKVRQQLQGQKSILVVSSAKNSIQA
jgi:hypothetical protein